VGREVRASLESTFGPISGVALAGTIAYGGGIRTYVTITAGGRAILCYYELNEAGGIEGVEAPTDPPTLQLLPSGDDRYHPDDPTGVRPEVTVSFAGGRMTLTGPAGSTAAKRAG
jgi:hypothetical protein